MITKEEAMDAWYAGFYATGEGWNGEYPFGHPGRPTDEERQQLREEFEKFWRSLSK